MNNGALSSGLTFMYFSGSFSPYSPTTPVSSSMFHRKKLVYNVYRFTITPCLAAGLQIISLKVAHGLKIAPNISNNNNVKEI